MIQQEEGIPSDIDKVYESQLPLVSGGQVYIPCGAIIEFDCPLISAS